MKPNDANSFGIQFILDKAWRLWTSPNDNGQELCARTLTEYIHAWRRSGLKPDYLAAILREKHPAVTDDEFNEMLAFLDDWEGAR